MKKQLLTTIILLMLMATLIVAMIKIEPVIATVIFSDGFEDGTHNAWTETGTVDINSVHVKTGSYSANTTWVSHSSSYFLSKTIAGNKTFLEFSASVFFSALNLPAETVYGISAVDFMRIQSDAAENFIMGVTRFGSDTVFKWFFRFGDASVSSADADYLNPVVGSWFDISMTFSINGSGMDYYEAFVNGTSIWTGEDNSDYGSHLSAIDIGVIDYNEGATFTPTFKDYFDDIIVDDAPPSNYVANVYASPYGIGSVAFTINSSSHSTPYSENLTAGDYQFNATQLNPTGYHFDHWLINSTEDSNACINVTINGATDLTICYESNSYSITISVFASPAIPAYFEFATTTYAVPQDIVTINSSHTFICKTFQYHPNSSYVYTFDHWTVNGSGDYGSMSLTLNFLDNTNLTMVYVGSTVSPPFPHIYPRGALNATWYLRSDSHTIHDIVGFKLLTVNTQTPWFDTRTESGTHNVSYGVRVWAIDLFGHLHELTSGSPVAVVTKSDTGGEMLVGYWNCPAYGNMIDSIMVKVYQKFDDTSWSPLPPYITGTDLLIRLPLATWTFHYYVNRTLGSTNSTFAFGSYTTYNTRIDLQYYKASPWDVALARLTQHDFIKFMFTPWTYWLGDMFWAVILFGCIVMGYLRTGSLKPILGILWILGGSGSILWALIPATALHIAVVMLALAMAITYFRLVYK